MVSPKIEKLNIFTHNEKGFVFGHVALSAEGGF